MIPKYRIIPVFVPHLGCPHKCVFCNQQRISGAVEPATPDTVTKIITEGLEKLGDGETATLAFYGGSFTAIPAQEQEALLGAVRPFMDLGRIESVRLSTRPDCIDDTVIDRLKRYGVKTVELGVQSMDEEVLKASERGHTAEDAIKAAKMLKDAGFTLILQMMTGLPRDTFEKSVYTAKKFIEMKPDGVRIYPTVIVSNTELFDMWKRGEYEEHTVEDAVALCAVLSEMFDEAGIPVIRLGLNPTEELSGGAAAAGAYHPALRDLVEGKRYFEKAVKLFDESDRGRDALLGVAKGKVSAATGQKRKNITELRDRFGLKSIKICECDVSDMEIVRLR